MAFLTINSFPAEEAPAHADALTRLRRDETQAIVVRDVLNADECAAIVADLEANRHEFPTTLFPAAFRSFFYGMNLNLADPALHHYFDMAPRFARSLDTLMAAYGGYQARVMDLLSRLDGDRPVVAPPAPRPPGAYMLTTFRGHEEGGFIPAHFDNEQKTRPSFRNLAPMIQGDLFSFVLTLSKAERGGALEVFDATSDLFAKTFQNRDTAAPKPDVEAMERVTFDVEAGTIVILRSGQFLHRVSKVEGARKRWTACSFMAEARGRDAIYCWG